MLCSKWSFPRNREAHHIANSIITSSTNISTDSISAHKYCTAIQRNTLLQQSIPDIPHRRLKARASFNSSLLRVSCNHFQNTILFTAASFHIILGWYSKLYQTLQVNTHTVLVTFARLFYTCPVTCTSSCGSLLVLHKPVSVHYDTPPTYYRAHSRAIRWA